MDETARARIAEAQRRSWATNYDARVASLQGVSTRTKKVKPNLPRKKPVMPEGWRESLSKAARAQWSDPEKRARMMESREDNPRMYQHLNAQRPAHPTQLEVILRAAVARMYPEEHLEVEFPVKRYRIDVAIPRLMLAFEADGTHWHEDVAADARRDFVLYEEGWRVMRFTERAVRRMALRTTN